MSTAPISPVPDAPARIESTDDAELAMLLDMYDDARLKLKEATERADTLKAALKSRAEVGLSDATDTVHLCGSDGAPRLALRRTHGWRLDSAKIKRDRPDIYSAFAVETSTLILREV